MSVVSVVFAGKAILPLIVPPAAIAAGMSMRKSAASTTGITIRLLIISSPYHLN
jgi:hypothetical protein